MAEPGPIELAAELVAARDAQPAGRRARRGGRRRGAPARLGIDDVRVVGPRGAPNLLARVPGTRRRPDADAQRPPRHEAARRPRRWERPPWEPAVVDGQLYGLGSGDMKGAVAAMVYAAAARRRRGRCAATWLLAFTADEEAGRSERLGVARRAGDCSQADAAILGEPCGITREWEAIRPDLARRVHLPRSTSAARRCTRASPTPSVGVNASATMARLIGTHRRASGAAS